MGKKKTEAVKKEVVKKKKKSVRESAADVSKDKSLNFMVQVNEPKIVRKDLLEALREIIIFMQGYESFRRIQEEKIATFAQLRETVKELNNIFDYKFRKYFPKGKLKMFPEEPVEKKELPVQRPVPQPVEVSEPVERQQPKKADDRELDDLELQLKDIESRLRNMN
ncbi:MAG: hypothetical protein AB1668_03535 [Nanoarchaeota archaeon]